MSNDPEQNLTPAAIPAATTPAVTGATVAAATPIVMDEPNLAAAILGGLVAALVGALVWALITVTTKFQIGFMAVGVGFLVAWAVRTLGKGHDPIFGVIGGGFALLGCLLGNLLSACGFLAEQSSQPVLGVTLKVLGNPSFIASILQATFNGMDLLFYAIAVYEGFKLARRPLAR
jgi:hypothetical protein